MSNDRPPRTPSKDSSRTFYPHLVATIAGQVGVIVVSAATRSMAVWSWVCLLVLSVALAAHAAVEFAPRASPDDQQPSP